MARSKQKHKNLFHCYIFKFGALNDREKEALKQSQSRFLNI